jgi:hypothetical protein
MNAKFTVFTSIKPAQLGKVFSLEKGQLTKKVAGNMYEGTYEVKSFDSPESFAVLLKAVNTNQAICTSTPRTGEPAGRVTLADKAAAAGCLARTKADFPFDHGPGVMTLDYDPPSNALSMDELWQKLCLICPDATVAGAVWWCSGSSHIHSPHGELQGLRGQRLYLLVSDVADTPRAGQVLAARCWLHGLGHIEVSRSGSLNMRSLWDEAMHQAARLDFIGGAVCEAPLSQQRGEPVLLGGTGWLDTATALPDLTEAEQATLLAIQKDAKEKAEPKAAEQRESWIANRAVEESKRLQRDQSMPADKADIEGKRTAEYLRAGTLYGNVQIPLAGGRFVTVGEVLDDPQKWNKTKTLDPVEPEHRDHEECGILYLTGGEPRLFSFAHGGTTYRLARQPVRLVNRVGKQAIVADALAKALAKQGDIFYSGEVELVQALPGKLKTLDKSGLQYLLSHRVALVTVKDGKDSPMNLPIELVNMAVAALGQKPEQTPPTLQSVTSLPYATAARRLVTKPGYDSGTGIFNLMQVDEFVPPAYPTRADCIVALQDLFAPWANFKWAGDADRAGMLAAIFTAVLRPAMTIAPGVFFDAPVQASGKTKAALALGALMTGDSVGVSPFVGGKNQEEENKKALIAMLRGERRFWVIDNVTGTFESAVIASLITSARVQGRVLGMSVDGNYSARVMVCATGNNATLGSDLGRRFICCRIDTGVERPSDISHSFEPAQLALETRLKIANAVLTLLQTYWRAPTVVPTGGADFPEWTKLVREPIIWLEQQGLTEAAGIGRVTDPVKALGVASAIASPEQLGLKQLLLGLREKMDEEQITTFQASDLLVWYVRGESKLHETDNLIREGINNFNMGRLPDTRSLGSLLKHRVDRRCEGLRLVQAGENRRGICWKVCTD